MAMMDVEANSLQAESQLCVEGWWHPDAESAFVS